ncbi:hypothetical protein OO014_02970 [Intrasporangium calvum]|uniref:Uncharacterized protein n=1 Tax=Intrasporangium calvum TaxID=53358 RepID=A0ABT5GDJ7_9MICO|nr:hypothetical protein [Intrasporangium calvum]MDC5696204.1 hypothetical protein [Intrasporangium calvum]
MTTSITLITPEYMQAELQARYGPPSRRTWRRRAAPSLAVEVRAHRQRRDEPARLATPARAY